MKIFRIREKAKIRVNLEILKEVGEGEDYEPEKPDPKKNIILPFLKKNFKIRVPRRGNKYYEVLIYENGVVNKKRGKIKFKNFFFYYYFS